MPKDRGNSRTGHKGQWKNTCKYTERMIPGRKKHCDSGWRYSSRQRKPCGKELKIKNKETGRFFRSCAPKGSPFRPRPK